MVLSQALNKGAEVAIRKVSLFQFSRSVMSNSAAPWTAACQAYLSITNSWSSLKLMSIDSCPCQWCHPAISSSVVPVSSCLQSIPASGSFQMSQFFASGGQSTVVSASISVLPMNTQDWSPLGWTGWTCLNTSKTSHKYNIFKNLQIEDYMQILFPLLIGKKHKCGIHYLKTNMFFFI